MDIKIKNCTHVKELPKGGNVYDIEWTQGDKDEVQKGQCFKEVIIEQTYKDVEITDSGNYGLKVKFPSKGGKENWNNSAKKLDEYRIASFAMSYSKDIIIGSMGTPNPHDLKDLPKIAESIFNWIKEHKI